MNQKILIALFVSVSLISLCGIFVVHNQTRLHPSNDTDLSLDLFNKWAAKFSKKYDTKEEIQYRFGVFAKKYTEIQEFNQINTSYRKGINQFSDLTDEEFKRYYLNDPIATKPIDDEDATQSSLLSRKIRLSVQQDDDGSDDEEPGKQGGDDEPVEIPDSINWATAQNFPPVRNTGKCAGGWAFAATTMGEFLSRNESGYTELSSQQVIDCVEKPEWVGAGCQGGALVSSSNYIRMYGQATASEYHAYNADKQQCTKSDGHQFVNDRSGMLIYQPLTEYYKILAMTIVSAEVNVDGWRDYESGIYNSCTDKQHGVHTSVNIVGYDIDQEYIIIRNSWGTTWGENGYMRLSHAGLSNPCNIFFLATFFNVPE